MQSCGVGAAADLANADNPVEQQLPTGRKPAKLAANGGAKFNMEYTMQPAALAS